MWNNWKICAKIKSRIENNCKLSVVVVYVVVVVDLCEIFSVCFFFFFHRILFLLNVKNKFVKKKCFFVFFFSCERWWERFACMHHKCQNVAIKWFVVVVRTGDKMWAIYVVVEQQPKHFNRPQVLIIILCAIFHMNNNDENVYLDSFVRLNLLFY